MIFEITSRIRRPDNTLEEQTSIVDASGLPSALRWVVGRDMNSVEAIRIEQSKLTEIDVIQDPPPGPPSPP